VGIPVPAPAGLRPGRWVAALRGLFGAGRTPAPPAAAAALLDEPALLALGPDMALVDFDHCPNEDRRRPHAFSDDGTRTCFQCGHTTCERTRS
jgi:hypothetical protein